MQQNQEYLRNSEEHKINLKLVVFLQGTTLIESGLVGKTREESVKKSREWTAKGGGWLGELVPLGSSPKKVNSWNSQSVQIYYLTASRKPENILKCEQALKRWSFPIGQLLSRKENQTYTDIVVPLRPDVIVEDDCESLGGTKEMVYPNLPSDVKRSIASVIVREFEGIDHLPDDPRLL
jgi:hypothetical protein